MNTVATGGTDPGGPAYSIPQSLGPRCGASAGAASSGLAAHEVSWLWQQTGGIEHWLQAGAYCLSHRATWAKPCGEALCMPRRADQVGTRLQVRAQ